MRSMLPLADNFCASLLQTTFSLRCLQCRRVATSSSAAHFRRLENAYFEHVLQKIWCAPCKGSVLSPALFAELVFGTTLRLILQTSRCTKNTYLPPLMHIILFITSFCELSYTLQERKIYKNVLLRLYCFQLLEELQNCITWEDKLTAFTKTLPEDKNLDFTLEDQKAMCSAIYYRIKALLKYDFSALAPIRTPITLLKPKILSLSMAPEDYGLGSVSSPRCFSDVDQEV